ETRHSPPARHRSVRLGQQVEINEGMELVVAMDEVEEASKITAYQQRMMNNHPAFAT
ncbi:hypothetical protein PIB30_081431, partial [Stylosanthes scabra]|nr:hypothetical protein [Stylosanthes scabra]